MGVSLAVSVVIPTFHRPELLRRCLENLLPQLDTVDGGAEIILGDDGGDAAWATELDPRISVVPTGGGGPGRARNGAVRHACGAIVAFTDDDAIPDDGWLEAALSVLTAHPEWVGVRGVVQSVAFDPLYEHSVDDLTGGGYLTCNVAYRTDALRAVGGFDPAFSFAHEDRDLGYRIERLGTVGHAADLVVTHPPRSFTVREWARRGRFVTDDWLLYARYPSQARGHLPDRWKPLEGIVRRWVGFGRNSSVVRRSPRRLLRVLELGVAQAAVGLVVTCTTRRRRIISATPPPPMDVDRPLRIAYMGPVPNPSVGGAPGVAGLLFEDLVTRGVTIDCFVPVSVESDAPDAFAHVPGITVHTVRSGFAFGKWYSSHPITKMLSAQIATARGRSLAARTFLEHHGAQPFDVLYQFSTVEVFGLPRRANLPPIVTHPSVHAAGELRWLRREWPLARRCQGMLRPLLVMAWVGSRTIRQRRDIHRATAVLAISPVFGEHLVADYDVDPNRVTVVRNVIDHHLFAPMADHVRAAGAPLRVLVLGRITVRKGLDDLVAATRQLGDLAGQLSIDVIGDHSLWSDYRPLLRDLDPGVATYCGHRSRAEVAAMLPTYDLLLQLSHYEPFGLTVAEALACGVPVVATTEVGAAQGIDPHVAEIVPVGDVAAIVAALRARVGNRDAGRSALPALARAEALRTASAAAVGPVLVNALSAAAGRSVQ